MVRRLRDVWQHRRRDLRPLVAKIAKLLVEIKVNHVRERLVAVGVGMDEVPLALNELVRVPSVHVVVEESWDLLLVFHQHWQEPVAGRDDAEGETGTISTENSKWALQEARRLTGHRSTVPARAANHHLWL